MAAASEEDGAAKPRLTGRAAILALVLAVLVVSYASSLRVWLEQRREISGLVSQIAASRASVHQMRQEKARWHDPAYIEAQARERFAWVLPGQIGFTVIGGGQAGDGDPLDPTRPASAGGDWWQSAWGSVLTAGTEPKADAGAGTPSRHPAHKIGPNAGAGHPNSSGGPGG